MEETLTDDSANLVERLLELGGRTSNATLRSKTGWSEQKYFEVRNNCLAVGLIGLARGRGGIVFLTENTRSALSATDQSGAAIDTSLADEVAHEAEYYKLLVPTIERSWIESEGFDSSIVELTASKRVKGVGRWTVPDIVVIGKKVYQYVPGFEFTVHSIEVKRFEALDATSVFEALNHRRASHFAYLLVVNYPSKPKDKDLERSGQITELCTEHDVGLVLIGKGDEPHFDKWDFAVDPADRHEPISYNLDGFIKRYLSAESKDAVAKMVR